MTALVISEGLHAGAYLVSEHHGYSRDQVTVALNQTIAAGQIVGKVGTPATETSSVTPDATNTGNGAFTLDPTTPVLTSAANSTSLAICNAIAAALSPLTAPQLTGLDATLSTNATSPTPDASDELAATIDLPQS
jgi:hypothetical protein